MFFIGRVAMLLFSFLTWERSPVGSSAMLKNVDNPFFCACGVDFKERVNLNPLTRSGLVQTQTLRKSDFVMLFLLFALTWDAQALWMRWDYGISEPALLKLPVSLPFLPGPEGPHGASAIPTWGEQYPKIILVCFPKDLVNRWFLKSPGFLPAWTCVRVILP